MSCRGLRQLGKAFGHPPQGPLRSPNVTARPGVPGRSSSGILIDQLLVAAAGATHPPPIKREACVDRDQYARRFRFISSGKLQNVMGLNEPEEEYMIRIACAVAVAAVACTALSGVAKAAAIAPLPAATTTNVGNIVPAYYWHRRYYPYRWHGGYYRYRWHGGYYNHRYYRYRHWRYW